MLYNFWLYPPQPQTAHPAAVRQAIQKYPLLHHQAPEQHLYSGCETSFFCVFFCVCRIWQCDFCYATLYYIMINIMIGKWTPLNNISLTWNTCNWYFVSLCQVILNNIYIIYNPVCLPWHRRRPIAVSWRNVIYNSFVLPARMAITSTNDHLRFKLSQAFKLHHKPGLLHTQKAVLNWWW